MQQSKQLAPVRIEEYYRFPSLYCLLFLFIACFVIGSLTFQYLSMYNSVSWITVPCKIVNISEPIIVQHTTAGEEDTFIFATLLTIQIHNYSTSASRSNYISESQEDNTLTFNEQICTSPSLITTRNCTADRHYEVSQVVSCARNRAGPPEQQRNFMLVDSLYYDTPRVKYFMPLIATMGITLPVILCVTLAGSMLFYLAHFLSSSSKLSYWAYMRKVGSSCGRKLNKVDIPFDGMSLVPNRFKLVLTHVMNILNEKESVVWSEVPAFWKILLKETFSKLTLILVALSCILLAIGTIVCVWVYPAVIFVFLGVFAIPIGYMMLNLLIRCFFTFYVLTSVQLIVIQGDLFGWLVYRVKIAHLQNVQVQADKKRNKQQSGGEIEELHDEDENGISDGKDAPPRSGSIFFAKTQFPRLKVGFEYIQNVNIVRGLLEDKMNYDANRQELFGEEL